MKRGRKAAMGRPIVHGGYSRLKSNLLKGQPRLRRYLEESRGRLIENLGGEDRLTCAQLILIDRAVGKLTVLRLMEARIAEVGAFGKDGELLPLLSKPYLRFADSLRKDLQALGIDRREVEERVLTAAELAAVVDLEAEKAKEAENGHHKGDS